VRIVLTLVVRDEVDIVDAQIAYHLNAGVEVVVATDHQSEDGTTAVLEGYERLGLLHLQRVSGPVCEDVWRTDMARYAARELGADWVINTDADEFWVPRRGSIREAFAAVPAEFGAVEAVSRHFVPRPDDERRFGDRMTLRFSADAPLNDPLSPYRPHGKVAHRGDRDVVVHHGAHRVEGPVPLVGWHPFDVFHFPYRSLEQYERKTVRRARGDSQLGQYVRGLNAHEQGRVREVYGAMVVDGDEATRGVEAGSLVEDTRLRDVLGKLAEPGGTRSPTGSFRLPEAGAPAVEPVPASWVEVAVDAAVHRDAECVRLLRFATDLAARVERIDQRGWKRARRRR
jgi:hypothetical protein